MLPCHRKHRTVIRSISRSCRSGFSLVELIAVIVILGMLAGLVTMKTRSYMLTSKQHAARVEIRKISEGLETFYSLHDRYPTSEEGLLILVEGTERMPEGILDKLPTDPWKNAYEYTQPGRIGPYEVISLGADGREGGTGAAADLSSDPTNESAEG